MRPRLPPLALVLLAVGSCAPHYSYLLSEFDAARLPAPPAPITLRTADGLSHRVTVEDVVPNDSLDDPGFPGDVRLIAAERSTSLRRGVLWGAIAGGVNGGLIGGFLGGAYCIDGCRDLDASIAANAAIGFASGAAIGALLGTIIGGPVDASRTRPRRATIVRAW